MKTVIADSSIASTNLKNSLQTINREKERISDNQAAVTHFEQCKLLRRRVLRYVCIPSPLSKTVLLTCTRFTTWNMSSGSVAFFTPTMNLYTL